MSEGEDAGDGEELEEQGWGFDEGIFALDSTIADHVDVKVGAAERLFELDLLEEGGVRGEVFVNEAAEG